MKVNTNVHKGIISFVWDDPKDKRKIVDTIVAYEPWKQMPYKGKNRSWTHAMPVNSSIPMSIYKV